HDGAGCTNSRVQQPRACKIELPRHCVLPVEHPSGAPLGAIQSPTTPLISQFRAEFCRSVTKTFFSFAFPLQSLTHFRPSSACPPTLRSNCRGAARTTRRSRIL